MPRTLLTPHDTHPTPGESGLHGELSRLQERIPHPSSPWQQAGGQGSPGGWGDGGEERRCGRCGFHGN